MAISLSKQTAQKIVDTVKDVCGHDINFINTNGIIFASTNSSRIGDFHEIGKNVILSQKTIEVTSDDSFYGTQKGVNIPFSYNREMIAAIGITGEPDEVRQFAVLAQKITSLILREQEIDSFKYGKRNQLNYVIGALIENTDIHYDYLLDVLDEYHLRMEDTYCTVLIKLNARYNISNLSMIENRIYQTFDQIGASLYTFHFPNEYILILPEAQLKQWFYIFKALAKTYEKLIQIGIGNSCGLMQQSHSYEAAKIAVKSLTGNVNLALFDELDLEILLGSVSDDAKKTYLEKVLSKLDQADIDLLKTYFSTDMSLKETAEILYLHKNTLQYKLNRIETCTGFNPRKFRHAVTLYLALQLLE